LFIVFLKESHPLDFSFLKDEWMGGYIYIYKERERERESNSHQCMWCGKQYGRAYRHRLKFFFNSSGLEAKFFVISARKDDHRHWYQSTNNEKYPLKFF
jgi:hypothetical protein